MYQCKVVLEGCKSRSAEKPASVLSSHRESTSSVSRFALSLIEVRFIVEETTVIRYFFNASENLESKAISRLWSLYI